MLRSKYKIISVEESDYGDHRHETTSDDSDMPGLADGDNESPPASDDDNVPALTNHSDSEVVRELETKDYSSNDGR